MYSVLLLLLSISFSSAITDETCKTEEFLKTFQCIGGLSEFVVSIDKYNLELETDRVNFTESCKEASDCFSGIKCLHADRLQIFLDNYCAYSTFLETEFKECKDKLDSRKETPCERGFKAFFDNTMTEDVKCDKLDVSLKCVEKEVNKVCGAKDASNITKYLVKMSEELSCEEVKKAAKEKSKSE